MSQNIDHLQYQIEEDLMLEKLDLQWNKWKTLILILFLVIPPIGFTIFVSLEIDHYKKQFMLFCLQFINTATFIIGIHLLQDFIKLKNNKLEIAKKLIKILNFQLQKNRSKISNDEMTLPDQFSQTRKNLHSSVDEYLPFSLQVQEDIEKKFDPHQTLSG